MKDEKILAEGELDAIKLIQAGIPAVVESDPMQFYYVLAELSDIEQKWLCSVCYWRYYHARPILATMSETQFCNNNEGAHCRECGV